MDFQLTAARLLSLCAAALALCSPPAAHAADLTVSAAASLTNAFRELAPVFEASHPGTTVRLNFAASGVLLQQMSAGAPVDVFASADQETMDQAVTKGLVRMGDRRNFVSNALVVITPQGARLNPASLNDLKSPDYKHVAIGNPASVPVGRYTQSVLEQAGLWTSIEPRMVGAQSVRQALDYVARGEVEAGFVYATDAAVMPDKVKVALNVPTPKPILYPIALTATSTNADAAKAFVSFIESAQAQTVLARYGFGKP